MSRTWSPYQENIFSFILNGVGNAVVEAVAGSGKTTTIVECTQRIPKGKTSIMLAFNKTIAEELKSRGVNARTFHSLTYSPVMNSRKTNNVETNKLRMICKQIFSSDEAFVYGAFLTKLVGLARNAGIGCLVADTEDAWWEVINHHDLELENERGNMARAVEMARDLLDESCRSNFVDFDDMLYLAVKDGILLPKFDYVFVDEAQDTNAVQRAIIRKICHQESRVVFVGDPCQPLGTQVQIPIDQTCSKYLGVTSVPIEQIEVGTRVVSYRRNIGHFIQTGLKVTGVTRKPFAGEMVVVTTKDNTVSKYTPNHFCLANFNALMNHTAIYVMRRGQQYRIGKCKMSYAQSSGIAGRMRSEEADCSWILAVYEDANEAFVMEQVLSVQYGIPQTLFQATNLHSEQAESNLWQIWHRVGNNSEKGEALLQAFGRDYRYPLVQNYTITPQCLKRPFIVHASNLIDGVKVLRYSYVANGNKTTQSDWQEITVTKETYKGDVISLAVEDTNLYIADGIVTHNCQAIYGFRGADSNSMSMLAEEFECEHLPLTISYRCPTSVIAEARRFVSHIEAAPDAPEGKVHHNVNLYTVLRNTAALCAGTSDEQTPDAPSDRAFTPRDLVVCRTTKPLIALAFRAMKMRIPVKILGREIGQGLKTLIGKMRATDVDDLVVKLEAWAAREIDKAIAKQLDEKVDQLQDKLDAILCLIEGLPETQRALPDLLECLESLFNNNVQALTLSTIHKTKGMEAKRVWWLNASACPSKWAKKDWQKTQEINLCYVAVTRAMEELLYIEDGSNKKNKGMSQGDIDVIKGGDMAHAANNPRGELPETV